MKKLIYVVLIISLLFFCGPKQQKLEKYIENGVEVVVNHIEPYKIKGEPSTLHLEEEFKIDTEKNEIADTGLVDISNFDVDSKGNIYCIYHRSKENCIFKFDINGNFVAAFGRRGHGPGELNNPTITIINNHDEIIIQNIMESKILILSSDGNLINEIPAPMNIPYLKQMENENYFTYTTSRLDHRTVQIVWSIFSPEFEKINEIEKQKLQGNSAKFFYKRHKPYATKKNIYIGKRTPSYEIWVYDTKGNLKRKIKKDYKPIKVSDEYKRDRLKKREEMKKRGIPPPPVKPYFPEYWPAFHYFFTDEEGRLFVMTYERSKNSREFVYDIFTPDGIFIGKIILGNYGGMYNPLPIKVKNNHLYCLRGKENGYKELVVYKMRWEQLKIEGSGIQRP